MNLSLKILYLTMLNGGVEVTEIDQINNEYTVFATIPVVRLVDIHTGAKRHGIAPFKVRLTPGKRK